MTRKLFGLTLGGLLVCSGGAADENPPDRIAIRYLLYQGPRGGFPPGAARA